MIVRICDVMCKIQVEIHSHKYGVAEKLIIFLIGCVLVFIIGFLVAFIVFITGFMIAILTVFFGVIIISSLRQGESTCSLT